MSLPVSALHCLLDIFYSVARAVLRHYTPLRHDVTSSRSCHASLTRLLSPPAGYCRRRFRRYADLQLQPALFFSLPPFAIFRCFAFMSVARRRASRAFCRDYYAIIADYAIIAIDAAY